MSAPRPWTTVEREALLDCKVFRVDRTRAQAPSTGASHTFFRLRAPAWVNVIPVTPEGDVLFVRQFRHGTQAITLEIPGGMVDPGESRAGACARELREETGYEAESIEHIGVVHPNPALFDNECHTYLATGVRRAGPVANEGAEETSVVTVPLAEVPDLIRRGAITHALVIAAFHWHGLRSR